MKILILCTGNSCRSQMAQGWLQSFDARLEVHSAGTEPAEQVNPGAVKVMRRQASTSAAILRNPLRFTGMWNGTM